METVLTDSTAVTEIKCPLCDLPFANLLKHLIDQHGRRVCNACENVIPEKTSYEWTKSGGALKSHWNSKHKTDFQFCKKKLCSLHTANDTRFPSSCLQILVVSPVVQSSNLWFASS